MSVSDKNKNRGAHGDSSFMLGGLPSSSENPAVFRLECHECGLSEDMNIALGYSGQIEFRATKPEDEP